MIARVLGFAIYSFCEIIVLMICAEAVMSWFAMSFSPGMRKFYMGLRSLTAPILMPFRKILQPISFRLGIDFSPVAAVFALQIISRILVRLVYIIF